MKENKKHRRPCLVAGATICGLNDRIHQNVREVDDEDNLSKDITEIVKQNKKDIALLKEPVKATIKSAKVKESPL